MSVGVLDGVEPRARVKDPVTSVDAARSVDLKGSQAEVMRLFRRFVPAGWGLADHELVKLASLKGSTYTAQRIRSARAELAKKGLLEHKPGDYVESPTGHPARVWTLAEKKED